MATVDRSGSRAPSGAVLARALPLLITGLAITFSADHSAQRGLLALGLLTAALAAVLGFFALRMAKGDALRGLHTTLGLIALVTSVVALLRWESELAFLLVIAGGWAVLSGAAELVWGIRYRRRHEFSRDARIVGGGTLLLAVVLALVADPVSAVGFLGAYSVVVGVFLVIAALSFTRNVSQKESIAL
jgi:uncharacterized membrane protein HdeD (DUF308 family)